MTQDLTFEFNEHQFKQDANLLGYFEFDHLPEKLKFVSKRFHTLAHAVIQEVPQGFERTLALRKLLEAKDCAVRATLR